MVVCAVTLMLVAPLPFFVIYLLVGGAYFVAGGLTSLLDWATRAKRGRTYQIVVGVSVAFGVLPVLLVALALFSLIDVALLVIFAATLAFSVMVRLR